MAIMAPADLPVVIKVSTEPMKKYVLSKLGHSVVSVEINEDQWEVIWKTAGDFISGYFPHEQRLALFWTSPLKSTYPLPADAYWVQQVNWDPITTRIDDVFGAESFLFCLADSFKILARDGSLQPLGDWKPNWRARTPYGNKQLQIRRWPNRRPLLKTRLYYTAGMIEGSHNHILAVPGGKWREFGELKIDDLVCAMNNTHRVHNIEQFEAADAISVRAVGAGCYYGCTDGEPILLH